MNIVQNNGINDFDDSECPSWSNDTTQLLYKQHIEDQSSMTHILPSKCGTPENLTNSYYKRSTATK